MSNLWVCIICGEFVTQDNWLRHLVENHKKEFMEQLEKVTVVCSKCKNVFEATPEPVITHDGKIKFIVPSRCSKCGVGFLVKYVSPKQIKIKKEEKSCRKQA